MQRSVVRKGYIWTAACLAASLVCMGGVHGQQQQQATTVDFRADVMTSIRLGDSTGLCLVGHVVFSHNGAVITCDSAIRYSDRMMDCYLNVVVNKDSTFIYGDKADYNGLLNEARIYSPLIKMVDKDATLYTHNFTFNTLTNIGRYYGNGTLSQKDNLMESDEGYYYADNREIIGVRNVQMKNPQYAIRSDSVTYNLDTEVATFDTPSYIWNDQDEFLTAYKGIYDSKEELYTFTDSSYIMTKTQEVWADTIYYRQNVQDAILRNNIQIADNEQQAMGFGDYAQYWGGLKQALLTRNPSVLNYETGEQADTVFMRADSIYLFTVDRFPKDSSARAATDSLASADSLAAAEGGMPRSADEVAGPDRPQSPEPAVPGGEHDLATGSPTPVPPSDSSGSVPAPGNGADSTAALPGAVPDSIQPNDSIPQDSTAVRDVELTAKELKKQSDRQQKLEKEKLRKEKEAERTAKVKAKIVAAREKAAAVAKAEQQQELDRQRKEIARKFLKNKATAEDSAALVRLDSLAGILAADTLSATADSTLKVPKKAPGAASDSVAQSQAPDSANLAAGDSTVHVVRGYRNVKIFRSDFQAVCDSIVGFSIDSTIHMYINPVLWNEQNQITAQTVDIFTKNQTIDKAVFIGDPLMCSRVDSTHFNQVKGKVMESYFDKGEIYKMDVNGNGQTFYYMEDGDSTDRYISGFLVAECAEITFRFADRQLNEIIYRGNPTYSIFPMDKIPESQPQQMQGFKWEIERKPTKEQIFNRTIRPSQRARYENLPRPTYPITTRIDQQREQLRKSGWIDRTERFLTQEAEEFIRSLGN